MDHEITAGIHDSIHCNVQVCPIPLSIVVVVVSFGSAGLLGLCAAELDPITFKVVLALTAFCAGGFFITTIWSVAESLVYRNYKGSKWLWDVLSAYWKRTMGLLPFRVAIKIGHGIPSLVISVWHHIIAIMGWLKRHLPNR